VQSQNTTIANYEPLLRYISASLVNAGRDCNGSGPSESRA
jgi:hypothetical protein